MYWLAFAFAAYVVVKLEKMDRMNQELIAKMAAAAAGIDTVITNQEAILANQEEIGTDIEALKQAASDEDVSEELIAMIDALGAKVGTAVEKSAANVTKSREVADILPGVAPETSEAPTE